MAVETILHQTVAMALLVLTASLAPILAATFVGLIVSLLQALTQIQEQTLGFAVKLIVVIATLLLTARWIGSEVYTFTIQIFDQFGTVAS